MEMHRTIGVLDKFLAIEDAITISTHHLALAGMGEGDTLLVEETSCVAVTLDLGDSNHVGGSLWMVLQDNKHGSFFLITEGIVVEDKSWKGKLGIVHVLVHGKEENKLLLVRRNMDKDGLEEVVSRQQLDLDTDTVVHLAVTPDIQHIRQTNLEIAIDTANLAHRLSMHFGKLEGSQLVANSDCVKGVRIIITIIIDTNLQNSLGKVVDKKQTRMGLFRPGRFQGE